MIGKQVVKSEEESIFFGTLNDIHPHSTSVRANSFVFRRLKGSNNITSGGPNNSLIKVYILDLITSSRRSTVHIAIVNRISYRIAPAEPRRIGVPPAESRRVRRQTSTDAWSPVSLPRGRHRHVVAGIRTGDTCWSGPARRTSIAGRQHPRFLSNISRPGFSQHCGKSNEQRENNLQQHYRYTELISPWTTDGGDSSPTPSM